MSVGHVLYPTYTDSAVAGSGHTSVVHAVIPPGIGGIQSQGGERSVDYGG